MRLVINLLLNIDRFLLLLPLGVVWILQGINVLPGSFMTGHIQWAIFGALLFAFEAALVVVCVRRMKSA
jgi:hypothetical protein